MTTTQGGQPQSRGQPEITQEFIEDNIMMLSSQTMGAFVKSSNTADLISVYMFYYYTAKWQKTNQPKATNEFVHRGLKMSLGRVKVAKAQLIDMGLIEQVTVKSRGKIDGWYIKVKYLWKGETISNINKETSESSGSEFHSVESPECGNKTTNALSETKGNALSDLKEILVDKTSTPTEVKYSFKEILKFYSHFYNKRYGVYPRVTTWGKHVSVFKPLISQFTEMQMYLLIMTFWSWKGATGQDIGAEKRLQSACYPMTWLPSLIDAMIPYITNVLKIDFNNEVQVRRAVIGAKVPFIK